LRERRLTSLAIKKLDAPPAHRQNLTGSGTFAPRSLLFILPINRDRDVANTPRAVLALIVLNSLVFLYTFLLASPVAVFRQYGFMPAHPHALNLFTSMFLHAGLWHILGNMWFLWMFGKDVENSLGMWLFSLMYLTCGVGGGLFHYLFNLNSTIPCVGASGAISGVMGCFFVLFPKAEFDLAIYVGWIRLKTIETHTTAAVGAWIAEQTLLGLVSKAIRFSSVGFWAHVGGFVVGIAAGLCFKKLINLDAEGIPLERPWFIPADRYTESDAITQLKL
jgi:membrane associated rhomboid family serine protease